MNKVCAGCRKRVKMHAKGMCQRCYHRAFYHRNDGAEVVVSVRATKVQMTVEQKRRLDVLLKQHESEAALVAFALKSLVSTAKSRCKRVARRTLKPAEKIVKGSIGTPLSDRPATKRW